MNQAEMFYAYLCPVCAHVEIVATRRVGPYHKALTLRGWRQHAMLDAGAYDASLGVDEIKARVLAKDWAQGVREIEIESKETIGVRYERARRPRVRVWKARRA